MLNEQQLVWRCRRGIRELDVLLGRFLTADFPNLDSAEQADFQRLLEVQDPVILDNSVPLGYNTLGTSITIYNEFDVCMLACLHACLFA